MKQSPGIVGQGSLGRFADRISYMGWNSHQGSSLGYLHQLFKCLDLSSKGSPDFLH